MIRPIVEIIEDIKQGKMVILVDEENRENEGDLVLAAEFANSDHINFMSKFGRGLICLTLTEEKCKMLELPLMVQENETRLGTNFTVSIEAAEGVTTGISANDRATTIKAAIHKNATSKSIVRPGHIFPLISKKGGVLVRAGHTEAGCDLAHLAGLESASVICEILNEDGNMARLPDLIKFSEQHNIKIGTIADLIEYRRKNEILIEKLIEKNILTPYGEMKLILYKDKILEETHIALVKGEIQKDKETIVRVHEPLSVIDLLDIEDKKHSWNALKAIKKISEDGGVLVFINHNTNTNDVLNLIGPPQNIGINNNNIWFYHEVHQTRNKYGTKVITDNNTLRLEFDDLGILKKINFLDKKALSKNPFDEANTISLGKDSSFLSSFLASMRQRAKNFGKTND
ncbi:MAG: 3,4-dihydroxy-2-butanone 4-phosphate synthase [Pseudomonadota bacterium]